VKREANQFQSISKIKITPHPKKALSTILPEVRIKIQKKSSLNAWSSYTYKNSDIICWTSCKYRLKIVILSISYEDKQLHNYWNTKMTTTFKQSQI